jgi:hypothetical protein
MIYGSVRAKANVFEQPIRSDVSAGNSMSFFLTISLLLSVSQSCNSTAIDWSATCHK